MLKVQTKVYLNIKSLKHYSKYIGSNDSILITENGLLNFSKQLCIPAKGVFEGTPAIFSGSFLKELLKERKDKIEVSFRTDFGKLVAFALKENPEYERDREIVDFSAQLVPGAVLKIPSREGTKTVSSSALQHLLMFTDYEFNFSGEVAYAYPYLKPIIAKFPNPFKGLKGYASGQTFKELKKFKSSILTWKKKEDYLYVFNGMIFFQKLEDPEEVEFPELPKEGWIKINPGLLIKALEDTYEWGKSYKIRLENKKLKIETHVYEDKFKTAEIPYYGGKTKHKEFFLSTEFRTYIRPFKKLPIVEINFAEEFVFLRYQKLEVVFKNAYSYEEEAEERIAV